LKGSLVVSAGLVCAALLALAPVTQAQELYEGDGYSGHIYRFTPAGTQSTFASGLSGPNGLAFGPALPSTPEPGSLTLLFGLTVSCTALLLRHRRARD